MAKDEFHKLVTSSLDKYENAAKSGAKENPEGKVIVYRMSKTELHIEIFKKGTFKIYADEEN